MMHSVLYVLLGIGGFAPLQAAASPVFDGNATNVADVRSDTDRLHPVSQKVLRYSKRVLAKYDMNSDGILQSSEYAVMHGTPRLADVDGDATITLDEFAQYVADFGAGRNLCLVVPAMTIGKEVPPLLHPSTPPANDDQQEPTADAEPSEVGAMSVDSRRDRRFYVPSSRLPAGLPDWFLQRDMDGDGQLTIAEFAVEGSQAQFDQFSLYDLNNDGMMTAAEYVRASKTSRSPTP